MAADEGEALQAAAPQPATPGREEAEAAAAAEEVGAPPPPADADEGERQQLRRLRAEVRVDVPGGVLTYTAAGRKKKCVYSMCVWDPRLLPPRQPSRPFSTKTLWPPRCGFDSALRLATSGTQTPQNTLIVALSLGPP